MGRVSTPNRAMASTSWPVLTAPREMRHEPSASSAITPRLGSPLSAGSNAARMNPTSSRSVRRRSAAVASRSVSCSANPRVLTTSAPSKLSWATAAMSPNRACTRADGSTMRRV